MLQENKIKEENLVERLTSTTEDGRKKEELIKEEKIGEETHKVVEVFEEVPLRLKLKTKVIEKKKTLELVYERETIIFDIETGEVVDKFVEKIDLPKLVDINPKNINIQESIKEDNKKIDNIVKDLKEKVKITNRTNKILDNFLIGVVVLQLMYLIYYFFFK